MTTFVTVIMPIRNEENFIARSLGAVLSQDYPHDCLEVLIADGMSTDNTRAVIVETSKAHPDVAVKVVDNPGKIVPTGINLALAQAKGDVIVRVDGHTIIASDYVTECVSALERSGADNVGGQMNAVAQGEFGEAVALATSSPFGVGGARFHYSDQEELVDTVYMGAWRKDVFTRIGNFDEELVRNQDDEFNYRLRSQGGKILLSNRIKSLYYNRTSMRSLWRQYFQYGYWKVRVMQKHPAQMRPRQFAPLLLVSVLGGGAILALFSSFFRTLWLLAVIFYVLANLAASWRTASKKDMKYFRWLPMIFATLHFAYGSGFIVGLVKFANRWQDNRSK